MVFDKYWENVDEDELFKGSKKGGFNHNFWHSHSTYRLIITFIPALFGTLFMWFAYLSYGIGNIILSVINLAISAYFYYEMIKKYSQSSSMTLYELFLKGRKVKKIE